MALAVEAQGAFNGLEGRSCELYAPPAPDKVSFCWTPNLAEPGKGIVVRWPTQRNALAAALRKCAGPVRRAFVSAFVASGNLTSVIAQVVHNNVPGPQCEVKCHQFHTVAQIRDIFARDLAADEGTQHMSKLTEASYLGHRIPNHELQLRQLLVNHAHPVMFYTEGKLPGGNNEPVGLLDGASGLIHAEADIVAAVPPPAHELRYLPWQAPPIHDRNPGTGPTILRRFHDHPRYRIRYLRAVPSHGRVDDHGVPDNWTDDPILRSAIPEVNREKLPKPPQTPDPLLGDLGVLPGANVITYHHTMANRWIQPLVGTADGNQIFGVTPTVIIAANHRAMRFHFIDSIAPTPPRPPKGCTLTWRPDYDIPARGHMHLIGPGMIHAMPSAFANTPGNVYRACMNRHLTAPHPPEVVVEWGKLWDEVSHGFIRQFQPFPDHTQDVDNWTRGLTAVQREQIRQCVKLDDMGCLRENAHFRSLFLKIEFVCPKAGPGGSHVGNPRGIQALQSPGTNVVLGAMMNQMLHHFSQSFLEVDIDKPTCADSWPTYGFGVGSTPERLGQWKHDMEADGYFMVEDDYKAFDSTQGEGAYRTEMKIYELFNIHPAAAYALRSQAKTIGFSKFLTYTVQFTRKSGDQNTMLGNGIINALSHAYGFDRRHNPGVLSIKMLLQGDDAVIAIKPKCAEDMPRIMRVAEERIKRLGLKPTIAVQERPTFCSALFVPVIRHTPSGPRRTQLLVPDAPDPLQNALFSAQPEARQSVGTTAW